jgi:signal transduction histidine kinase
MRLKKLSHQFLLNYVIILSLIIIIGASTLYIYNAYYYWLQDHYMIELERLEDDYETKGLDYARAQQAFTDEDFIMVLTPEREVIASSNAPYQIGKVFSEKELQEVLYGDDYYYYMAFFNQDNSKLFVIYTVNVETGFTYVATIVAIAVLIFGAITMLFAKYSSNQILLPILTLVKGVEQITHGDYNVHIAFDASNELNILKDEINTMTQTLKKETERRSQLEENRKQLIRDISHDIRTPLTNILGYSDQLIHQGDFTSEMQKQSIEIINQYGLRANTLISELFDLSRYEVEENNLEMIEADLVELIRLKIIDYINEFEKKKY